MPDQPNTEQPSGGDYMVPADVVAYLGQKFFDELVEKARKESSGEQNPYTSMANSMEEGEL